nr:MAG TPA: minor tail protein [Bacteriophage sp.]
MKLSKGDVTYELRADDSKLESDINEANKKVEKAVKNSADETVKIEEQKTSKLKDESDKNVKNAEQAIEKIADAWIDAGKDAEKAMDIDIKEKGITVDVKADTSNAENKIKGVSRDKSIDVDVNADVSDVEDSIEGLGDTAEKVGSKMGDALGNVGGGLKSAFSDAANESIPLVGKVGELTAGLSGSAVAAIGVGAAAVGVGALAVGTANDISGAMNDFIAITGKGTEETERYQAVMEDIYANNYGESFSDIGQAMAEVTKQLGDMDDASLQNVTESAFALRDTFGYDIPESTRAAKAMVDNFGVSGEEAMNLIASGAQNGLDYSGELLDSISEYSVQFDKMGLGAEDMFAIFQKGAESGAFNLDKVGDAVKEMSIRVVDGSDTTKQGFELLGLNADEMAQKFAAGGDTAKEAFNETLDALAAMEDPIAQNTAGVDLIGTMWEDLGPEAVTALAGIEEGAYKTSDAMEQIKDVKYDDLGSMFEELKRNVEVLLIPLGEALLPVLSTLIDSVLPILTGLLGPLISLFAELLTPILNLIQQALQPLMDAFLFLMDNVISPFISLVTGLLVPAFSGALDGMLKTAKNNIGNITNIFRNIIDFIKNVFTGNWKAAWENVKDIFKSIVDGLGNIFKSPLNFIIDGINGFLGGLNNIKIPNWVPGVGGKGFNIPKIPRLKVGMDYVPSDFFPAFLDEGEWVLTKEEANLLRSLGGLEGMVAMSGSLRSDSVNVNVQGGTSIDYVRLGNSVADALIRSEVAFKCDERVFGRLVKDVK